MIKPSKTKKDETNDKGFLSPGLYIIGTPIGNLEDITIRALRVFSNIDFIFCENTRITTKLLRKHKISIKNKLISYNDHNAKKQINLILSKLKNNMSVALVSDAGTPLISDPGYRLVNLVKRESFHIYSIPGPSSIIASLSIAGVTTDKFSFLGFLSKNKNTRLEIIEKYSSIKNTLVIFERASRLPKLLNEIKSYFYSRSFCIAREITKIHEEVIKGDFKNLEDLFEHNTFLKGEVTLLINSESDKKINFISDYDLRNQLKKNSPARVASLLAKNSYEKRDSIYKRCIKILSKEI